MLSTRCKFITGVFAICLLGAGSSAMADDLNLCVELELVLGPLYEVPMGYEDWPRIHALENAARAIDCTFIINN
jgi:hypothetical protein